MMNSNEKSLQVIDKRGIFLKIINFFKKILGKDNSSYIVPNNTKNESSNNNSFWASVKIQEDPDIVKLLKIQDELERKGINTQNVLELTKDLSEEQKKKLEKLYEDQIKEFELSFENYKNQINAIRKKLGA